MHPEHRNLGPRPARVCVTDLASTIIGPDIKEKCADVKFLIQHPLPIQHPPPIKRADKRNAPKGAQKRISRSEARGNTLFKTKYGQEFTGTAGQRAA